MKRLRKAEERGHVRWDWLDTYHTFSFGEYYDPKHMGWGPLRVMNDDTIAGGGGFPMHPHRDMEIFSYVTEGALAHKDSMGSASQVHPGRVQLMGAGTGVYHSEFNPSETESTRLLQIWIQPERPGLEPSYQEKDFDLELRRNRWLTLVSPQGEDGMVDIRQDVRIYNAVLDAGNTVDLPSSEGRKGWLQVADGELQVGDLTLKRGDGLALEDEASQTITTSSSVELLYFDLPA
ncbi:MAG: pirin family protein [Verrucomicrobiae bacterium]|nr:pirin family protein [Verrucomicrobiae bacterium]